MTATFPDNVAIASLLQADWSERLNTCTGNHISLGETAQAPSASELPGQVVVIDHAMPGAQPLLEAYAVRRPEVALVLIGDDLPANAVRAMIRFTASDIIGRTAQFDELTGAVESLVSKVASSAGAGSAGAQCWALRGAVGGAGVTTIAIEMAFAALNAVPSKRVCLIDLNLTDGSTAAFLDGEKKLDIAALCSDPARIDPTLLRAYAWEHPKGIFLMAPPRNPRADFMANEEGVLRLLDVACGMFDQVIVDVPRHTLPWTEPILAAVDEVGIVSELTVPSLHAAAELCRDVDSVRGGAPSQLILNRMFAKRSHRHSFPIEKAERAIHRGIDTTIRSDWESARMAVNLGVPVAQVKPKSPLVRDVADLVSKWAGVPAQAAGWRRA